MSYADIPLSVRLDPSTVELLDGYIEHLRQEARKPGRVIDEAQFTRAAILRHAVTAGLDTLTDQPPLKLKARQQCQSSTPYHQTRTGPAASD